MSALEGLRQLSHKDYTVGWICALPIEQCAVLLDEYHEKIPAWKYELTYILGRIDVHNVVVACLPGMGTVPAAQYAARLHAAFKSLRFILMVGIGGGVPTLHDVRLGDIVINRPPNLLVTAVAALDAQDNPSGGDSSLGHRLADYVTTLTESNPKFKNSKRPNLDILFNSVYLHRDSDLSCKECGCDPSQTRGRRQRGQDHVPQIHKGLIASGDGVMRNALERDRLAKELNVLCFEMEAGGLMADLGSLVIRGICDYCDSHKDKKWQGYAAAVAAAYARELLKVVPGLREISASPAGEKSVFQQATNASIGQSNNFAGPINVSGGQATIGATYNYK